MRERFVAIHKSISAHSQLVWVVNTTHIFKNVSTCKEFFSVLRISQVFCFWYYKLFYGKHVYSHKKHKDSGKHV